MSQCEEVGLLYLAWDCPTQTLSRTARNRTVGLVAGKRENQHLQWDSNCFTITHSEWMGKFLSKPVWVLRLSCSFPFGRCSNQTNSKKLCFLKKQSWPPDQHAISNTNKRLFLLALSSVPTPLPSDSFFQKNCHVHCKCHGALNFECRWLYQSGFQPIAAFFHHVDCESSTSVSSFDAGTYSDSQWVQFFILLYGAQVSSAGEWFDSRPSGMYTILFGLYTYLQVYQQGQMRYYQVSLLLLYLSATASVVLTILSKNQYDLYVIATTFTQSINPIGFAHFTTYVHLECVFIPFTLLYILNLNCAVQCRVISNLRGGQVSND